MLRPLLNTFLTLVFLVRSLVPAGYMLSQQPGAIEIIICSGNSSEMIAVDQDGNRINKTHDANHAVPCDWALATGALLSVDAVDLPSLLGGITPLEFKNAPFEVVMERLPGSYSARGPPISL